MEQNIIARFRELKSKYNDCVLLHECDGDYVTFDEDAQIVSSLMYGGYASITTVKANSIHILLAKLQREGHKVVIF